MEADAKLRTARDLMTSPVYVLRPDMLTHVAALALLKHRVSSAPVVNDDRAVIGMISELDLLRALAVAAYAETPSNTVEGLMSRDVVVADPDDDVFKLTGRFIETGVRCVPVVSQGCLMGVVARRDLMYALEQVCEERMEEHVTGTVDLIAELELIHNPFPQTRTHKPG